MAKRRAAPGRNGWRLLNAGVVGLTLAAGCRGDGTGPEDVPALLVRLTDETASVPIGEVLEPPLRVRVLGVTGAPLAGVSVRFAVVSGPGTLGSGAREATSRSASDGVAQATFTGGTTPGAAVVRVDLPVTPAVTPLDFSVRTLGAQSVALTAVSGNGQEAEARSQLALPFVVRATDSRDGTVASGVRVEWSLAVNPGGGRLSVPFGFTGTDGSVRVLLTLGEAGVYRVLASSPGQADTVSFSAIASEAPGGSLLLESVSPLPLRPGLEATLTGNGFGSDPGALEVRVEGEPASILSSDPTSITFVTPPLGEDCLPARTVGIRVLAGDVQSNGLIVDLIAGAEALTLAPGERRMVSGETTGCLQFAAGEGEREYRVAVQSASTSSLSLAPMRLVIRSGPESGAGPVPLSLGGVAAAASGVAGFDPELRLRESAREALRRAGARPVRSGGGDVRPASAPPRVGDRLTIELAVRPDLTVSCQTPAALIQATVREAGERFTLLEDDANPVPLDAQTAAALLDEFDQVVFPVDSAYFGRPVDIDGNQRVLVLVTREVNALTPAGSGTFIGGFFVPTDLADDGDASDGIGGFGDDGICPTSNEAELLYLLAPDPQGVVGDPVSAQLARRNARTVTAHEFEHLLSAEERIFRQGGGFDDLEDAWLSEGLAHLAEEVVGLRAAGLGERANLGAEALDDIEAFNAFHINNFARLRQHLRRPNETLALTAIDPGGFESLQMRGFGWLFARWLGDHFGPDAPTGPLGGSGEFQLFRELSTGGAQRLRGVANVLRAVEVVGGGTRSWAELIGDFSIVPAVDDAGTPDLPQSNTLRGWNLPALFLELHENPGSGPAFPEPYPLALTVRAFSTAAFDFDVRASTAVYFQLAEATAPAFSLELLSPSGGTLPLSAVPQVTVVRTR